MQLTCPRPWHPQDKAAKDKIDGRNQLETFCYNMKNNVEEKMADKIDEDDKEKVLEAVKEALEWMEENSDAGERERLLESGGCTLGEWERGG